MMTISPISKSDSASTAVMPSANPFALLDLPVQFDLAAAQIEAAYFAKSKLWHPDNFAGASAAQRVVVLSNSRAINDAYKTLRKPVDRAEALLAIYGVTIGDHERLEPAFLMEILELREDLAEARHAGNLDDVERMHAEMLARRNALIAQLSPAFETAQSAGDSALRDAAFAQAKQALIILRYVNRYLEECDAALDVD
jgi:molecular chaperone HscB